MSEKLISVPVHNKYLPNGQVYILLQISMSVVYRLRL